MNSISFGIDDLITALAYDFMTTGRYIDDALTHITGYIDPEEYTDDFEVYMFNNFRHLSKLLDSFNSVILEEETRNFYLDLINQLWEYQDNPENNQAFKDKVYASVLKNPSLAAFAIYNGETEGIIEKEIISRLTSFSEDTLDFKYTVFNRAIKDFISDNSWRDYRNFDWRDFNLQEKLEQMRSYGLLEYEDLFSKDGITVTDLGSSVSGLLDSFNSNGYAFKPFKSFGRIDSLIINPIDTEAVAKAEEIEPSVDDVDVEPLLEPSEMDVMYPAIEQLLIEGSEPLKFLQSPDDISNFLTARYLAEYEEAKPEVGLPDVVRPVPSFIPEENPDVWSTEYEGREFPYGIHVNGNVEIALDEGRKNVVEILNRDGRVSDEFMHILYDYLDSGCDSASAGNGNIDAANIGINLLMALNYTCTENEIKIINAISSHEDVMAKIEYM